MQLNSIYEFQSLMTANNLVMIYEGEFNQEITKGVLAMTEKNLNADNVDAGIRKKVYNVMVETLQNICKHQYNHHLNYKTAIFIVGETSDNFLIISGNCIKNSAIENMQNRLDLINSKDKEGLKQLFKELRLNSTVSEVGGAGLGFVDIARKSENKLEYLFEMLDEETSYFTLLCTISKNQPLD